MKDVPEKERPDPCPWEFRLIAGHRRYMALDYWTDIYRARCCIIDGLTGGQARALNFTDNLQRRDLNILQEAEALLKSWGDKEIKVIARLVGESKRWVQTRLDLLLLPDYVQKKAAAGQLSQYDIETLAGLDERSIELTFQGLVTTKGKKGRLPVVKGRQPWRKRPRGKEEIGRTLGFVSVNKQFSNISDENLAYIAATLSWVTRDIDSKEFLENRLDFPQGCVIIDKDDKVKHLKGDENEEAT